MPKRKRVLRRLAYIADRVLLQGQRTDERKKMLRSCDSKGQAKAGSALIKIFRGLLLSGKSACKERMPMSSDHVERQRWTGVLGEHRT